MKKIKNLIFILILGSVSAAMLLGIKAYTAPIIKHYQEMQLKMTLLTAAGIAFDKDNEEDVNYLFKERIRPEEKNGFHYYLSPEGSYIFEYKGRGLWGMIEGVLTLKPDMKTIESIQIVSQEETPGLGGRIGEQGFLNGFKDKVFDPVLIIALRTKATRNDQIDAITGATISTQALLDTANNAVALFRKALEKDASR